jgi:hypothetical protein
MPSVFIPVPQFPSVPPLPGVPQLVRALGALSAPLPPNTASLVQAPTLPPTLATAAKTAPVWGIFDSAGNQVVAPDSIMDFNYRSEFRVSDYPVQAGQFANYNKVTVPYEIPIRMVVGSTLDDRTQFISDCETVVASLDLYTVITPERTYVGLNPTRFEMSRRETSGAFFIEAEMYFRQIQQVTPQYSSTVSAAANTSNAQNPGAQPVTSLGLVQPQAVPSGLSQTITDITTGALPSA